MSCPHCASPATTCQPRTTALGYQIFRCAACRRTFNERTGTPFNFLEYPTDIVLLVGQAAIEWRSDDELFPRSRSRRRRRTPAKCGVTH